MYFSNSFCLSYYPKTLAKSQAAATLLIAAGQAAVCWCFFLCMTEANSGTSLLQLGKSFTAVGKFIGMEQGLEAMERDKVK